MRRKNAPKFSLFYLAVVVTVLFSGALGKKGGSYSLNLLSKSSGYVHAASATSTVNLQQIIESKPQTELVVKKTVINSKIESLKVDQKKVKRVYQYLSKRGAPLAAKAEYLVKTADEFGVDFRLIPAISIIESSGGKHCYKPYNAWGWGGSMNPYIFKNWEEAIYTVTRGLSKYYASGATTPALIAPRYNPHTPNEWARKVQYVMNQI